MKPKVLIVSFVVCLLFVLLILFVFTFGYISNMCMSTKNHSKSEPTSSRYQYLQRNYRDDTTISGLVSLPQRIKENEYLSYRDEHSNVFMISNLRDDEYECFGTCFCDEEPSERRIISSSGLASRTVSMLLVSITSLIAYEKAKSYFERKCIEELEEECNLHHVKSKVEECSLINNQESDTQEDKHQYSTKNKENKEEKRRMYFCYGNCVTNGKILRTRKRGRTGPAKWTQLSTFKRKLGEFECEKLRQEGEVTVTQDELWVRTDHYLVNPSMRYRHIARSKFQEHRLKDYCKENSIVRLEKKNEEDEDPNKIGHGCVARSQYRGLKSNLKNVRCRQIDPLPLGNTRVYWEKRWWGEKKEWDEGRIVL